MPNDNGESRSGARSETQSFRLQAIQLLEDMGTDWERLHGVLRAGKSGDYEGCAVSVKNSLISIPDNVGARSRTPAGTHRT